MVVHDQLAQEFQFGVGVRRMTDQHKRLIIVDGLLVRRIKRQLIQLLPRRGPYQPLDLGIILKHDVLDIHAKG